MPIAPYWNIFSCHRPELVCRLQCTVRLMGGRGSLMKQLLRCRPSTVPRLRIRYIRLITEAVTVPIPRLADKMRQDRANIMYVVRTKRNPRGSQTPAGKAFIGTLPPPQCKTTGLVNSKVVVGPWGATPPSLSLQPLPLQTRSAPSLLSPCSCQRFRLPIASPARSTFFSSLVSLLPSSALCMTHTPLARPPLNRYS